MSCTNSLRECKIWSWIKLSSAFWSPHTPEVRFFSCFLQLPNLPQLIIFIYFHGIFRSAAGCVIAYTMQKGIMQLSCISVTEQAKYVVSVVFAIIFWCFLFSLLFDIWYTFFRTFCARCFNEVGNRFSFLLLCLMLSTKKNLSNTRSPPSHAACI